jgi:mono/diheme cytochrome c family protein
MGGPQFDQAAVDRGHQAFVATCGVCHGANAKGGESGPDLIRSELVLDDEGGKQLGTFLKTGRPDRGMPKFDLPPQQVADIATFLHERISAAANRGSYEILNILVGDAKAGQQYFAAHCTSCHSATGDLKGIGAKYDAATLQDHILMPRQRSFRRGPRGFGIDESGPAITATVTLPSGESTSGMLVRLTDFDVTVRDAGGVQHTFRRDGDTPRVVVKDPIQAHIDMLPKWTDADIHNLTAYLVTLK